MKPFFIGMLLADLALSASAGLRPIPDSGQASAGGTAGRGTFTVELVKALDSKKLKQGDAVEAKLTGGITLPDGVTAPRGAKVIGHVTEAKARSGGQSESALGIQFDKIVRPDGGETPIKGIVLAAAPDPNQQAPSGTMPGAYPSLDTATTAGVVNTMTALSVPLLNAQSRGVSGINNLQLGTNGVFTSTGKAVKLDSGIRMLLDVTVE